MLHYNKYYIDSLNKPVSLLTYHLPTDVFLQFFPRQSWFSV